MSTMTNSMVKDGEPVAVTPDGAAERGADGPGLEDREPRREGGKLVVFTRRMRGPYQARAQARDINARLGLLERDIEQLNLGFSESRDSFTQLVADLKARTEGVSADIARTALQAEQNSAEQPDRWPDQSRRHEYPSQHPPA